MQNSKEGILLTICNLCANFPSLTKITRYCLIFLPTSQFQIVSEFMQSGFELLETYFRSSLYNDSRIPKNCCFDDLGTGSTSKYFGNDCNVMAEILLTRYDLFKEKGIIHITTNLSAAEIESQYGNRFCSRMREMFNLFGYEETSNDKRK